MSSAQENVAAEEAARAEVLLAIAVALGAATSWVIRRLPVLAGARP